MASHAWEGIGLMDYGQLSLQRVIARQRVRGREEGQLPVSTAPLLPYQLVGGRSMFRREGEERKEAVASGNV